MRFSLRGGWAQQFDYGGGVFYFDNQLIIFIVLQLDNQRIFSVVHVPENTLILLQKSTRGNKTGNVGTRRAEPFPLPFQHFGVLADAFDMA